MTGARLFRLPGGRFEVEGSLAWLQASLAAAELLGPRTWWAVSATRRDPRRRHEAARRWASACRRRLAIDLRSEGLEHIDPGTGYVVVSLHESFADALALLSLPLAFDVAARSELSGWRALGAWLNAAKMPVVDPERPIAGYRAMLRHGRSLARDEGLLVFPQGTILGIETAFHAGAFALADAVGRPVLPVVVAGGHRVWEHPFSPRLRFGQRMWMEVLEPVPVGRARARMPAIERSMKQRALAQGFAPVRHLVPERDGWWDGYGFEIDADHPNLARRLALRRQTVAATYHPVMTSTLGITGHVARPTAVDAATMRTKASVIDDAGSVAEGAVGVAVRVSDLLADAGPSPEASHCTVIGDGGAYRASIPIDVLVSGGWLAFELDGAPLPAERGGPFRLTVAAGDTLCWNVKRVETLDLTVGPVADDVPENPPH